MKKKVLLIASVLIATLSGHAQIIYTNINPDTVTVMSSTVMSQSNICKIDFDNDGFGEYNFRWDDWGTQWFMHLTYDMATDCKIGLKGTTVNQFGGRFVQPLLLNDSINATDIVWGTSLPEPFIGESTTDANFLGLGDRYIPVRIDLWGQIHYGWILVNFAVQGNSRKLTIKSYAYNSTPNAPILAGQTTITTGINVEKTEKFEIYPNPAKDNIALRSGSPISEVRILNNVGQVIYYSTQDISQVDVSGYSNGLYFIEVYFKDGNKYATKFSKE